MAGAYRTPRVACIAEGELVICALQVQKSQALDKVADGLAFALQQAGARCGC